MTRPIARRASGAVPKRAVFKRAVRAGLSLSLLGLLAACASSGSHPTIPVAQEAAEYRAKARNFYEPPGPPSDPWGPYIRQAAARFDVPDAWIRAVMHQESGGHEFIHGQFVTSQPGAMGLMQVMPFTYDEMRSQYGLGDDAYEPHDNIMAGTAYIRQMYDIYGSPGFLAAYNAGPGRLDDFLTRNRPLPAETRHYVAAIGGQIDGIFPNSRSQADLMAMAHRGVTPGYAVAAAAPPAQDTAQTRQIRLAWARRMRGDGSQDSDQGGEVQVAEAPATAGLAPRYGSGWKPVAMPQASAPAPFAVARAAMPAPSAVSVPVQLAAASQSQMAVQDDDGASDATAAAPVRGAGHRMRFHLVSPAMAETVVPARNAPRYASAHGDWAIQVGAFGSAGQASAAAGRARAHVQVSGAHAEVASLHNGRNTLYRARLTGLSRDAATAACARLGREGACMVVSPDASRS